ncbi:TIGR03826 family flagellar region protein [Aneurinibacillus terranovensis]|uniref:TIGR03826 family flagellar region protein n=1 Tax=Aneurinibacillus terranovensis TaxID=278991 RepID=UPI0004206A54|nr:TIGR03826 family flagellar region protein [Aneurinibacillus terranovensis]
MSLNNVINCPRCGKIFIKIRQPVCPECVKEIDKEYDKCYQFLRKKENRGCTTYELSKGTGVSVNQITRFILEGRLSIENAPNMGYPCESCGTMIRSGKVCDSCLNQRKKAIQSLQGEARRDMEQRDRERKGHLYRSGHDEQ